MSKGTAFFLLVVAVIAGLIASAAVNNYISQYQKVAQADPVDNRVNVIVAQYRIPAGTAIKADHLTVSRFPAEIAPERSFRDMDSVLGRVVRTTIFPGEIIVENRLEPPGAAAGLSALIPEGQRAITLKVNDTSAVAGFINPGNYVDVVTTIRGAADDEGTISKVILQNVKVIATGQEIERDEENKAKIVPTVTVLATLEQAERLSLASDLGDIRLVLRNQTDKVEANTAGVTLRNLLPQAENDASPPMEMQIVPTATPQPKAYYTVKLHKGGQTEEYTFQEE